MVVEQLNPTEKKSKSISSQCLKILKNSHFIKSTIIQLQCLARKFVWDILVTFNHSVQPTKPTFVQADTKILWWWSKVSSNQQLVKKWENFFSWSGNPIFPFTLLRPINVSWVVRVAPNNQISSPLLGDLILVSCCKKSSSPNMLISTCFYSSSFSSGFHFLASGLLDPYLWSS